MSWQDIMRRVLPPVGNLVPHITSAYGVPRKEGTSPHLGIDFDYSGGQHGINLKHPGLGSPVAGIVTNAGQGSFGRIGIRDANGFTHEILHTHSQHVNVGDPVAAGQLIGTMGNTGTKDQHVHYQLRDPDGNITDPSAFWDRQDHVDPNPSPPAHVQDFQQYLHGLGVNTGTGSASTPAETTAPDFVGQNIPSASPPDRWDSFADRFGDGPAFPDGGLAPRNLPGVFGDRFGNWTVFPEGGGAPRSPNLPAPAPEFGRTPAFFSGKPIPQWITPQAILPDDSAAASNGRWPASPGGTLSGGKRSSLFDPAAPAPSLVPPDNPNSPAGPEGLLAAIAAMYPPRPNQPASPPLDPGVPLIIDYDQTQPLFAQWPIKPMPLF